MPSFARRVAKLGPNAFVNITNDAWFGRTAEPYQHLALAVFRAVEHRLEMVRAVNTGVSAHIDAAGRVLQATESVDPDDQPAAPPKTLLVDLAMLPGGGLYRTVGDLFGFLCLLSLVALLAWRGGGPAATRSAASAAAVSARSYGRRRKNRYLKSCRSCLKAGKRISFATSIAQLPVGVPANVDPTWTDCTVPLPPTT